MIVAFAAADGAARGEFGLHESAREQFGEDDAHLDPLSDWQLMRKVDGASAGRQVVEPSFFFRLCAEVVVQERDMHRHRVMNPLVSALRVCHAIILDSKSGSGNERLSL